MTDLPLPPPQFATDDPTRTAVEQSSEYQRILQLIETDPVADKIRFQRLLEAIKSEKASWQLRYDQTTDPFASAVGRAPRC